MEERKSIKDSNKFMQHRTFIMCNTIKIRTQLWIEDPTFREIFSNGAKFWVYKFIWHKIIIRVYARVIETHTKCHNIIRNKSVFWVVDKNEI